MGEAACDLTRNLDCLGGREFLPAFEFLAKGFPFDVLHREVVPSVGDPGVDRVDDVRVVQTRDRFRLAEKIGDEALLLGAPRVENLDCDRLVEGELFRAVHRAHRASSDRRLDLETGDLFTIVGTDNNGTLGTEISLFVDGVLNTKIHTSCSQPVYAGLMSGLFVVDEGYSLEGGLLCPLGTEPEPEPDDGCGCEGKATQLTLQYNGSSAAEITVKRKVGKRDDPASGIIIG